MSGANGWIGVDLDGTLAEYTTWKGLNHIGRPIPAMLDRVRKWLAEGRDVRIFTARVSHDGSPMRMLEAQHAMIRVMDWCEQHLGRTLPVTCTKDFAMIELWDDRCVQVKPNTGEPVEGWRSRVEMSTGTLLPTEVQSEPWSTRNDDLYVCE